MAVESIGDSARPAVEERRRAYTDAWLEWQQACALARCGQESRECLLAFAASRFNRLAPRHAARLGRHAPGGGSVSARDAWHLFETHLTVPGSKGGKRYKDWLFDRVRHSSDLPFDVIQGGASLIMRDVVRRYVKEMQSPLVEYSMDRTPGDAPGSGLSAHELLAGPGNPADDAARREYERLAEEHAAALAERMDERDRVVFLARATGRSFTDPAVEELSGMKKSNLFRRYKQYFARLVERLESAYPEDDRQSVLLLAALTFERLQEIVFRKEMLERRYGSAFNQVEER